jgi:hypothetical protein
MTRPRHHRRQLHGAELALDQRRKALGDACEALVRLALDRPDRPWWIQKVRRARAHEDRRQGIDVVIHSDVGRLFLQVKRSHHRAEEWKREHQGDPRPIGLVVARETEAVAVVYGRALGALILLRERLQREQRETAAEAAE